MAKSLYKEVPKTNKFVSLFKTIINSLELFLELFLDRHETFLDWACLFALGFGIMTIIVLTILLLQDAGITWVMHDNWYNYYNLGGI